MINCQYQLVVLKYGLNLKVEFWQNSRFRHQSLLNLHLFACSPVLLDLTWSELRSPLTHCHSFPY